MASKDPRVDAYITNAANFAKPILKHLRRVVHQACPDVEETFKWSFPCFMHQGMLCSMAAFKHHCSFGFWKHKLLFGKETHGAATSEASMGQFGRITCLSDLPAEKTLRGYIHQAMRLNEAGIKLPRSKAAKHKRELEVPGRFLAAMRKHQPALHNFQQFSLSHRREYVEWITEAKREDTRERRITAAVEWLAAGKPRNWKYMNC